MKTDESYDVLIIRGDEQLIPEMNALLQSGFYLKVPAGKSLRDVLLHCGFSSQFIDSSIKTIFRNSQPVDDIDRTRISDGDQVGLSGSMPGLVGATLRSGSYLAAYRRNISIDPEVISERYEEGFIRLKVFNVVLKEAEKFLLNRGIFLKSAPLHEFLTERNSGFFHHCQTIVLNGKAVDFGSGNLNTLDFPNDMVFLSVKKSMKVKVKLFATLQKDRFKTSELEYSEGTTVAEVCRMLGIPRNKISIIFVNSIHACPDRILEEGDVLALFPPIGGG